MKKRILPTLPWIATILIMIAIELIFIIMILELSIALFCDNDSELIGAVYVGMSIMLPISPYINIKISKKVIKILSLDLVKEINEFLNKHGILAIRSSIYLLIILLELILYLSSIVPQIKRPIISVLRVLFLNSYSVLIEGREIIIKILVLYAAIDSLIQLIISSDNWKKEINHKKYVSKNLHKKYKRDRCQNSRLYTKRIYNESLKKYKEND